MPRQTKETSAQDEALRLKINELRLSGGLSMGQLAESVGVSPQQMAKYLNGSNKISGGKLPVIAKVLKVKVGNLFEESEINDDCPHKRLAIEVSRNFMKITNLAHQKAVSSLIKSLMEK